MKIKMSEAQYRNAMKYIADYWSGYTISEIGYIYNWLTTTGKKV